MMLNVGRRLALAVCASTFAACIALGGVLSAHGAIQTSSSHTPEDGGLSAFAINPQSPQIVYAGSALGVFKSTDAGRRWQVMNAGLTEPYVVDLAIDRQNPDVLYAATHNYAAEASSVFKSMNAGRTWRRTWRRTSSTGNFGYVDTLAVHPRNARVVYAGTDDGVYKSSDAGASWRKVKTARRVFTIALDPQQPATIYAGSGGGVFKSTDAGRSWRKRNNGLFPETGSPTVQDLAEGYVAAIVVSPRDPRTLYLGCENGVFKSTDGALTWRAVNSGLRARNGFFRYAQSLAIDPNDTQTLYAGTAWSGLVKTTNGGRRWNATGLPVEGSMLALALEPTNSKTVYVGMSNGGKAFKSMDGGRTWTALSILW